MTWTCHYNWSKNNANTILSHKDIYTYHHSKMPMHSPTQRCQCDSYTMMPKHSHQRRRQYDKMESRLVKESAHTKTNPQIRMWKKWMTTAALKSILHNNSSFRKSSYRQIVGKISALEYLVQHLYYYFTEEPLKIAVKRDLRSTTLLPSKICLQILLWIPTLHTWRLLLLSDRPQDNQNATPRSKH